MWLPSTNFQVILNQYQMKLSAVYSAATRWQNDVVTKRPLPCPPTGSTAISHTGFHSCCHHLPLQCHLQAHFHYQIRLLHQSYSPKWGRVQYLALSSRYMKLFSSEQDHACHSFPSAQKDYMGKSVLKWQTATNPNDKHVQKHCPFSHFHTSLVT